MHASRVRIIGVLLVLAHLGWGAEAHAQECIDPVTPDCDGDGYAPPEDCDDQDPEVNPGAVEICNNGIDDDCNGIVDEDCYYRFQDGRLEGGSTCEDSDGGWAVLLLLPLMWRRRRT